MHYIGANWNQLPLPDENIDRIISRSAAFTYGHPYLVAFEVDRVARKGTLLRAEYYPNKTDPAISADELDVFGNGAVFARNLAKLGWNVWKFDYVLIGEKT